MLRGLRAAGHPEPQAFDRRAAAVARGNVPGQEGVARADPRARLLLLDADSVEHRGAALEDVGVAAVLDGHDRLDGTQPRYLRHRLGPVVDVVELVADELLGLELVRRDDVGF